MNEPGISVDRAVHHYVESIDVSPSAIADFYEELPFSDKPPLEDRLIHFSGLAQIDGPLVARGACFFDPKLAKDYDPQAPDADIVMFVGSLVMANKLGDMNEALKRELTLYAQGKESRPREPTTEEVRLKAQLDLRRGPLPKILFVGKAAVYSVLADVIDHLSNGKIDTKETIAFGVGGAALTSLIDRRKKREAVDKAEKRLEQIQANLGGERQAYQHGPDGHEIVRLTARAKPGTVLPRRKQLKLTNRAIDKVHHDLSLKRPAL